MEVVAVSSSRPSWQIINGVRTFTSIIHQASPSIEVSPVGIVNNHTAAHDAQVYIFFTHHYDYWTQKLGVDRSSWDWCHWGENITFKTHSHLDERDFHLGDKWQVGHSVILQVCGARVPCNKLSWRCGQKDRWLKELADSGFSGVYLTVVRGGTICPGDQAELIEKHSEAVDVASISRLAFDSDLKTRDTLNLLVKDPYLQNMNKALFRRKLSVMHDQQLLGKHAWSGWRDFRAENIIDERGSIKSFHLKPVDGKPLATYLPGQYLNIKLPTGAVRNWSISDWPSHDVPDSYRISIKKATEASVWMHESCQPESILRIRAPMGRFHLDWTPLFPGRQVYISAGIGITPMLAMMKAHVSHFAMRKAPAIWLHVVQNSAHFPARFVDEIPKDELLKRFIFFTKPLSSDIRGKDYQYEGRPTLQILRDMLREEYTIDPLNITPIPIPGHISTFYICGPLAFEASIKAHLTSLSVPASLVHSEVFSSASNEPLSALETADVEFHSGKSVVKTRWSRTKPLSLLEIAEEAGLAPEFGCRVGTCGSCKVKLLCGSVAGGIQSDGTILICSARPISERVEIEL